MISSLTPCSYNDGYINLTERLTPDQEREEIEAVGDEYEIVESGLRGWPGNAVIRTASGATFIAEIEE
jgi:hypothetical protein